MGLQFFIHMLQIGRYHKQTILFGQSQSLFLPLVGIHKIVFEFYNFAIKIRDFFHQHPLALSLIKKQLFSMQVIFIFKSILIIFHDFASLAHIGHIFHFICLTHLFDFDFIVLATMDQFLEILNIIQLFFSVFQTLDLFDLVIYNFLVSFLFFFVQFGFIFSGGDFFFL